MDGIHYPITKPRPFDKIYKSHKLGCAGLAYEFVVLTHKNKLVAVNGPFPAGTNDKTIFRDSTMVALEAKQQERGKQTRVIADSGYTAHDLAETISFRNEFDPPDLAYFKDRALSRHESFNRLTKHYKIMTSKFLHDRGNNPNKQHPRHQACLLGICVTVQCELDLKITSLLDPYTE